MSRNQVWLVQRPCRVVPGKQRTAAVARDKCRNPQPNLQTPAALNMHGSTCSQVPYVTTSAGTARQLRLLPLCG